MINTLIQKKSVLESKLAKVDFFRTKLPWNVFGDEWWDLAHKSGTQNLLADETDYLNDWIGFLNESNSEKRFIVNKALKVIDDLIVIEQAMLI